MTTEFSDNQPRLRKTETRTGPGFRFAVATYAVLVKGKEIGTVTKHNAPGERNVGSHRRPAMVPCRRIYWTADIYAGPGDQPHERRRDAVESLLWALQRDAS